VCEHFVVPHFPLRTVFHEVDGLLRQLTRLQQELESCKAKTAATTTHLQRIQSVLNALEGKPTPSKTAAAKVPSTKAAATKQDVIEAVYDFITANDPFAVSDLQGLVSDRITTQGKSRLGFSLRFAEAIADARFVKQPNGSIALRTA
jgi:hypothetical protein